MTRAANVAILTYHGLSKNGEDSANGLYTLEEKMFQAQMTSLAEQAMSVISLKDLIAHPAGEPLPRKAVVITFDDGHASDFSVALPVLKRHRFQATFFVNPGTLDQEGYLTTKTLRQMRSEGMEIGSHGYDHLFLTTLDEKSLRYQIVESRKKLEALLGAPVSFFSVPRGRYNRRLLEVAKEAGYLAVLSSDIGFNRDPQASLCLRLWAIKQAYRFEDFRSIVEGRPKAHLRLEVALKQAARRALGHAVYEAVRTRILGEKA